MSRTEMLGALRERQFRLLWLGQTTSVFGNGLVPVALAFAVLGLTGSASDVGFVLAAETVPMVVFLLAGGVWADRLPRQLVMLASDAIRGTCQTVIAVLLLTGHARLWHLLVLSAVYGTAEAFFRPASTGLLPSTVTPARLQQANALVGLSNSAAGLAGPAVAGILVGLAGAGVAFAVDAGTFVVSGISLALLRPRRAERPARRETFLAELVGGWREFTAHTWLWVIVVWASTYLFAVVAPIFVLGPLVAKESLGGAPAWGAIQAAFFAGGLVGGATALRWRPPRPILACTLSVFLVTPAPALLAVRAPVAAIAAAQLGAGIAMGLFAALWETTLQQHVAPDKLSRVSSYDWFGSIAFMPLGFAVAGPVAGAIGVSTTFWLSTAWVVASTALVLLVPEVRELRRVEAPPAEAAVPEPLPVP